MTTPAHASLQRLTTLLAVVTGLAQAGRQIDLAGLDNEAGKLCAQVLDLDPADKNTFRPMLIALFDQLGALDQQLRMRSA